MSAAQRLGLVLQQFAVGASPCSVFRETHAGTSPVWVIKTRLQLQHNASPLRAAVQGMPGVTVTAHGPEYRGFFHAAAEIWRREGIRGMFKVPAQFFA